MVNFVIYDSVIIECNCEVEVMSGRTVGGESDWNLCGICGGKVSDVVRYVGVVSQHKTVVNVSTENKQASGVVVRKKCEFAEQQNQVGNLPTMVATH